MYCPGGGLTIGRASDCAGLSVGRAAPAGLIVRRSASLDVCLRAESVRNGRCELAGLCVILAVSSCLVERTDQVQWLLACMGSKGVDMV